jgi:hypothetical protein
MNIRVFLLNIVLNFIPQSLDWIQIRRVSRPKNRDWIMFPHILQSSLCIMAFSIILYKDKPSSVNILC